MTADEKDKTPPETAAATEDDKPDQDDQADAPEQPQKAWDARRDLIDHIPLAEGLVGRDQYGVSGGQVNGDLIFQFGSRLTADTPAAGPMPQERLKELELVFQRGPCWRKHSA